MCKSYCEKIIDTFFMRTQCIIAAEEVSVLHNEMNDE